MAFNRFLLVSTIILCTFSSRAMPTKNINAPSFVPRRSAIITAKSSSKTIRAELNGHREQLVSKMYGENLHFNSFLDFMHYYRYMSGNMPKSIGFSTYNRFDTVSFIYQGTTDQLVNILLANTDYAKLKVCNYVKQANVLRRIYVPLEGNCLIACAKNRAGHCFLYVPKEIVFIVSRTSSNTLEYTVMPTMWNPETDNWLPESAYAYVGSMIDSIPLVVGI